MDSHEFSSCSRIRGLEELPKDADPGKMTVEGNRQTFDTLWQPLPHEDRVSRLEALYNDLIGKLMEAEKEKSEQRVWSRSVDTRLQFLESCYRPRLGGVTQKELHEKEEYNRLKEKIKNLEARNKELLSKAMSMHKDSENMNDPSRLSAVLQMYDMLRLHEWEKFRSSQASSLTYRSGSSLIKKLFDTCERDIEERTNKIFEILDIPPSNDAMTNSKQAMMQEIRNLFRYSYYQNHTEFYNKIIKDPPVKALWNLQESSTQYLDHVDKKDWEHWGKTAFLWPVMKCGENIIAKGVIWDEK